MPVVEAEYDLAFVVAGISNASGPELGIARWVRFWRKLGGRRSRLIFAQDASGQGGASGAARRPFMMTRAELDWFYGGGGRAVLSPIFGRGFKGWVPGRVNGADLIVAYHKRLFFGGTRCWKLPPFARAWTAWENGLASIEERGGSGVRRPPLCPRLCPAGNHYFATRDFWKFERPEPRPDAAKIAQMCPAYRARFAMHLICRPRPHGRERGLAARQSAHGPRLRATRLERTGGPAPNWCGSPTGCARKGQCARPLRAALQSRRTPGRIAARFQQRRFGVKPKAPPIKVETGPRGPFFVLRSNALEAPLSPRPQIDGVWPISFSPVIEGMGFELVAPRRLNGRNRFATLSVNGRSRPDGGASS